MNRGELTEAPAIERDAQGDELGRALRDLARANAELARLSERAADLEARLERAERERQLFVALVENSADFIGIADAGGKPVYVNPAGRSMVGLGPDHPIEATQILDYYPPEHRPFASEVIVPATVERGHWAGDTYFRNWQTEEAIPVSDTHFMIRQAGTHRILGMGTITRDVSSARRLEAERARESEKVRAMLEAAPDALVVVGTGGAIQMVNAQTEGVFGWQRDELIGQPVEILLPPALRARHVGHRAAFVAAPHGRPMGAGLDLHARRKDGTEFPVEISLAPVRSGDQLLVMAAVRDVTERRHAERERGRLAAIVESSEDAIIGRTLDGRIETWNAGAARLYGYSPEEVIGQPITILTPPDRVDEVRCARESVRRGETVASYETVQRRKDGSVVDVSVSHSPIRDRARRIAGVSTIARDISERKQVERRLEASLAEKEILLREIYHRVKNNLQVISSLLNLQGARVDDALARDLLTEAQTRVRSIALVHEKLYGSRDLGSIHFGDYLRALTSALWSTYGASARRLALQIEVEEVRLGIEAAVPCGLLVNELVCNALKHAYPAGRTGTITVALRPGAAAGEMCLTVADDGVGLPEGLDFRDVPSLGMQLVCSLTKQLRGTIELDRSSGTCFSIRFPQDL